jgi:hypothetical protein
LISVCTFKKIIRCGCVTHAPNILQTTLTERNIRGRVNVKVSLSVNSVARNSSLRKDFTKHMLNEKENNCKIICNIGSCKKIFCDKIEL